MIIDTRHFIGDIRIEGLVVGGFMNEASNSIKNNVEWYIGVYGDEYLVLLLGGLYKAFISYVNESKSGNMLFDDIINMLRSDRSPMAMYVYFYYQRCETLISTSSKSDDVDVRRILAHTSRMMIQAWNNMVDFNGKIRSDISSSHGVSLDMDSNILSYVNGMNI